MMRESVHFLQESVAYKKGVSVFGVYPEPLTLWSFCDFLFLGENSGCGGMEGRKAND